MSLFLTTNRTFPPSARSAFGVLTDVSILAFLQDMFYTFWRSLNSIRNKTVDEDDVRYEVFSHDDGRGASTWSRACFLRRVQCVFWLFMSTLVSSWCWRPSSVILFGWRVVFSLKGARWVSIFVIIAVTVPGPDGRGSTPPGQTYRGKFGFRLLFVKIKWSLFRVV